MSDKKVRLAELDCQRLQFQDGDRLLVRVYQPVTPELVAHITKTLRKWAGKELEVLVSDGRAMEIKVERSWERNYQESPLILLSNNQ